MDIEKSIEFLLQAQAKTEAALAQHAQANKLEQQQLTQQQLQLAENMNRLVDVVADIADSQQRFQEENRLAHQRYDAAHRETGERFNALIKMMDEWVRERGQAKRVFVVAFGALFLSQRLRLRELENMTRVTTGSSVKALIN